MFTSRITKYALLLATPLAAIAVPENSISKRFDPIPFSPATTDLCKTKEHHTADRKHTADMLDCLLMAMWAADNNGSWILEATTNPDDPNDWHVLRIKGNCAFLVKNTKATSLGNRDVADMIDSIHLSEGLTLDPVEDQGAFGGCQNDAEIRIWLRDSKFSAQ